MKRRKIISLICLTALAVTMMFPSSAAAATSSTTSLQKYQWAFDASNYSSLKGKIKAKPVVAVIDTGVDYTNPSLSKRMWRNTYDQTELPGTYGYDFADDDDNPMDTIGHGSHCAGIITGMSNANIMALKVSKDGKESISTKSAIKAFEYIYKAQKLGVKVVAVNCSWAGSSTDSAELKKAIRNVERKGANVIFAAGNNGTDWEGVPTGSRYSPYCFKTSSMIVVGASDEKNRAAEFSDTGRTLVDIFAPGSNMLSTVNENSFLPYTYSKEKRSRLVKYYNAAGSKTGIKSATEIGIESDYKVKVKYDKSHGFKRTLKSKDTRCLEFSVKTSSGEVNSQKFADGTAAVLKDGKEQAGYLYLDVTDKNYDTSKKYYISIMYGMDMGINKIMWQKLQYTSTAENCRFVTVGEKTYLALIGIEGGLFMDADCYIDNIAVSNADVNANDFGKYDLMSGTSMAAPVVTAAVADIYARYPKLSPAKRKSVILDSAKMKTSMENKCLAGGIIDFGQFRKNVSLL